MIPKNENPLLKDNMKQRYFFVNEDGVAEEAKLRMRMEQHKNPLLEKKKKIDDVWDSYIEQNEKNIQQRSKNFRKRRAECDESKS